MMPYRPLVACPQGREALAVSEVPIGCVLVRHGAVIASGRNYTNQKKNVTPSPTHPNPRASVEAIYEHAPAPHVHDGLAVPDLLSRARQPPRASPA